MGKIPILSKDQKTILGLVSQNSFLREHFYFTGGTALSAVYFQHRYSDDLDFFSENQFESQVILTLIDQWSKKYHFSFNSNFIEVVYIFILNFKGQPELKIDFSYYPYQRLQKGELLENIEVDSLLDIAVNKLLTVTQRTNVKDFVDLYFLLNKFTVWDLMEGVKAKFRQKLEPILLAADFLKVDNFDLLPKMITPLNIPTLQKFFRKKAQEMGATAVE